MIWYFMQRLFLTFNKNAMSNLKWMAFFGVMLFIIGCKQKPPDGSYCAKVIFTKPDAKRQSHEMLLVDVKDNFLTKIDFQEGHFDTSSIKPSKIPQDGKLIVFSSAGYEYKIEMKGSHEKCKQKTSTQQKDKMQCKGKSQDGKRCQRTTDNKNGFCWQHQPH